ncbi:MAG: VapC toxin family PIN domain ribonuclease [Propionibacteriaceae bacterium]|nr:VapC toxin family PIN domain ribonuclease [Propionibacteriaceae bacterium]
MSILLDSNVLIALTVPNHVHHGITLAWFTALSPRYATCPITQGALVRFAIREGATAKDASCLVAGLSADPAHEFWEDNLRFDQVNLIGVIGHRQVTDSYLAALARWRGSQLATLDRGLAAQHSDVTVLIAQSGVH